jgi:putative methionine-R-sulfoxide reductase with GAF domain
MFLEQRLQYMVRSPRSQKANWVGDYVLEFGNLVLCMYQSHLSLLLKF